MFSTVKSLIAPLNSLPAVSFVNLLLLCISNQLQKGIWKFEIDI